MYFNGFGVEKDYNKAREYYELSAKLNNAFALFNLGNIYLNGYGIEQDYTKAKDYYELSVKLNNEFANFNLGFLYLIGKGVEKNLIKAKELFNKFFQAMKSKSYNFFDIINEFYLIDDNNKYESLYEEYFKYFIQEENSNIMKTIEQNLVYDFLQFKPSENPLLQTKKYIPFIDKYIEYMYIHSNFKRIDFRKYLPYFESIYKIASEQGDSSSLNLLGVQYYYGCGVEKDYSTAKKYFDLSAKQKNSYALLYLGYFYHDGFDAPVDYLRAKCYFESSAKMDNPTALYELGNMYKKGNGITANYSEAARYYEKSAKLNNSNALLKLGNLYYKGLGVKQNYEQAFKCYKLSSYKGNSKAFIKLAEFYSKGIFVQQNYLQAKKYYELASLQNNPDSFFYLGDLYSNGEFLKPNYYYAIQFFKKCIEIENETHLIYDTSNESILPEYCRNKYKYRSSNDLGLIYLLSLNDFEEAHKFIKNAAYAEYPFAQNNYGLLFQFYLNDIDNAYYMYRRSKEHNFALAEYNIGHLLEEEGKYEEAIEFYIKASEDEDHPLIFHRHHHYDKRLKISKTFIICFTNLKLVEYYFSKKEYEKAKKYFIKTFEKLNINDGKIIYTFNFILHMNNKTKNDFSYLKSFIINYPQFNLINQPNLDLNFQFDLIENKRILLNEDIIIKEPVKLFEFIIKNEEMKDIFISEIHGLIQMMKNILYKPPYNILFGRISIETMKKKLGGQNINDSFYEGLGDIF